MARALGVAWYLASCCSLGGGVGNKFATAVWPSRPAHYAPLPAGRRASSCKPLTVGFRKAMNGPEPTEVRGHKVSRDAATR